jgi:hypothetical protein
MTSGGNVNGRLPDRLPGSHLGSPLGSPLGSQPGSLLASLFATALAGVALLVLPLPAGAQSRTMHFRPVPAESASTYEQRDRAATTRARDTGRDTSQWSTTTQIPAAPAAPEVPEAPEAPHVHSTSSDIVRFGSDVTISQDQEVDGDVVSFGGAVEVRGHVTGNVSAMGGDLTLASTARVDGDVVCIGGSLREEPGSSVGGQRVTAPRSRGARFFFPMLAVVGTGVQMLIHAIGLLIMLGFAWLFVKLAPARTQSALDLIDREPGPAFIIGLLLWALIIPSVIALALVIAVLCITIIGIPLAAAVAVAYAAFFVVATLWGSIVGYGVLGHRLYPRFKGGAATLMQAVLWGAVALHGLRIAGDLLHVVPVFGFVGGLLKFIHFVVLFGLGTLGAGALVRGEYQRRSLQTWWHRMRPPGSPRDVPPRHDVPPPPPPPPTSPSGAEVIS